MSGRTSERTKGGMLKKGILGSAMLVLLIGMIGLLSINTTGTTTGSVGHALMPQHTSQDGLLTYMNDDGSTRSVFGLNLQDNGDGDNLIEVVFTITTDAGAFDPTTDLDDIGIYFDDSNPQGEYDGGDNALTDTFAFAGTGPWTVTVTITGGSWAIPDTDNGNDAGLDFFVCFETNANVDDGDKFTCSMATDGVTVTGPTTITTNAFTSRRVVIDTTDPALPSSGYTAESNKPGYFYNPGLDGVRSLPGSEEKVYYNNMPGQGLHQRVWVNWTWVENYPYIIDYDEGNDNAFNEDLPDTMYSNDAVMTYMLSWDENGMTEGPDIEGVPWGHRLVTVSMTDLAGNTADYEIDFFQDNDAPDIMTEGQFGGATEKCNSSVEWFYPYDAGWDQDDCWLNGVYHVNESNYFLMSKADPLRTDGTGGGTTWDEAADIYEAKYSVDGGTLVDFSGAAADADIGALAPGEHTITYSLTDHVNNTFLRTDTVVVAKYIGDYTVSSNMLWAQNAYLCNGNVTIDPTFQMDLTGTLFMNNSDDGDHWIHNEGTFKVRDGGIVTNLIDPTVYGDDGPCVSTGTFDQGFLDTEYGFINDDGSSLIMSNDALVERANEIEVHGSASIYNSIVQDNDDNGILAYLDDAGDSLMIYGGSIIRDTWNGDGVDIRNADFADVTIKGSNVTGHNDDGIELDNASGYFLNSNIMDNGGCGIYLANDLGTGNVSVEGCNISENDENGFYTDFSYYYPFYTMRGNSEYLWSGNPAEDCVEALWETDAGWDDANFMEFQLDLSGESLESEVLLSFWNWYWGDSNDYGMLYVFDVTTLSWKAMTSEEGYQNFGDGSLGGGSDYSDSLDWDSENNDGWILDTFDMSDWAGWPTPIPIRFYYISDSSYITSGWFVDDVYLTVDGETTVLRDWEATGGTTDPRWLAGTTIAPNGHWTVQSKTTDWPALNFDDTEFWDNDEEYIEVYQAHSLNVRNCLFMDAPDGEYGIYGGYIQNVLVEGSHFENLGEGIDLGDYHVDAIVRDNTFIDLDYGFYASWVCDADVYDNYFYDSGYSIYIEETFNYEAVSGTQCLNTAHNTGLDQTVTVTCNLAGTTNPVLSYYERIASFDAEAMVEVSTDGGNTWEQVMWYHTPYYYDQGNWIWEQRFIDLTNWTGMNILVRFNYNEWDTPGGDYSFHGWWLDDIDLSDYTSTINYQTDFDDLKTDDGWTTYGYSYDDEYLLSPWEHGAPDYDSKGDGPEMAHSGDYLWGTDMDDDNWDAYTSYLQSPAIDLSGATPSDTVLLSYWEWIDIYGWEYDQSYVLVSDGGLRWDKLYGYPDTYDQGDDSLDMWHPMSFDVSDYAGSSEFYVRFTIMTENSGYPGWYIDDLSVTTMTPGANLIFENFDGPSIGANVETDFWYRQTADPNIYTGNVIDYDVDDWGDAGIFIEEVHSALVDGNQIHHSGDNGIHINSGSYGVGCSAVVSNNDVRYNNNGLRVGSGSSGGIVDVQLINNDARFADNYGLWTQNNYYSMYVYAEGNDFSYADDYGMYTKDCRAPIYTTLVNNDFSNCEYGMYLELDTSYIGGVKIYNLIGNNINNNDDDGIYKYIYDVPMYWYMEGNDVSNNDGYGAYLEYGDYDYDPIYWFAAIDNTFSNNYNTNLYLDAYYSAMFAHIEGNDLSGSMDDYGLEIYQDDYSETNLWLIDNTINNNYDSAIYVELEEDLEVWMIGNEIRNNMCNGDDYGVYLYASEGNLNGWFEDNTYVDNVGYFYIYSDETSEITFFGNTIDRTGQDYGLYIESDDYLDLDFHDNIITNNYNEGFYLDVGSDTYGRIYNNIFSDNGVTTECTGLYGSDYQWGLQVDGNRFEDNGDYGMEWNDVYEPLRAHSGTHAYHPTTDSKSHSQMEVTLDLTTAQTSAKLSFWHWLLGAGTSTGGFVEVNDGTGWERITPNLGYDGDSWCYGLNLPDQDPTESSKRGPAFMADTESITDEEQDWEFEEFDLTPWIGNSVVVRWQWGVESEYDGRGWYIDDIELTLDGTRTWFDDAEGESTQIRVAGPGQTWFDDLRFRQVEFFPNDIFNNEFIGNLEGGLYIEDTYTEWSNLDYEWIEVYDNLFSLNGYDEDYYGLEIYDAEALIHNNEFIANSEGVFINSSDARFYDNIVSQNVYNGVEIEDSGFDDTDEPVLIRDNVFTSNGVGLNIGNDSEVKMINNDFLNNYEWGVYVMDDNPMNGGETAEYVEWLITGTSTVKNNAVYWYGGDGDGNMNPGNIVIRDGGTLIAKDNKLFGFGCSEPGEWALIVEAGGMLDAHDNNFRAWYQGDINLQDWTGIANVNPGSNPTYQLQGPILTQDLLDYAHFGDSSLALTSANGVIMNEVPWGTDMDTWGQYQVNYPTSQISFYVAPGGGPGGLGNVQGRWFHINEPRDYWRFRIYGSATLDGNDVENARTIYVEEGFSTTRQEAGEVVIIRENEIYNSYMGGIYVVNSHPEIFLNEIHDTQYGVYYEGGTVDITRNNWFYDITADAVHMEDTTGVVSGNTFTDNREGVVGYRCEGVMVHDNDFTGHVKDAIHFVDSNGIEIHHNLIDMTIDKGVYIDSSTNMVMNDNVYTWNYYGLYVSNAEVEVTNDVFSDSARDDIYADEGAMVSLYDVEFDWTDRLTVLIGGQVDVYYTATVQVETPMGLPIGGVAVTIDPQSGEPLSGETDSEGQYLEQLMVASFDGTQDDLAEAFETILVTATSGEEEETFEGPLSESLTIVIVLDFKPVIGTEVSDNFTFDEDTVQEDIFSLDELFQDDGDPANLIYTIDEGDGLDVVVDEDGFVTIIPDENYFGVTNVTFVVSDGMDGHDVEAFIVITVTNVEDVPEAMDALISPVDPNNRDALSAHFTLMDFDYDPATYSEEDFDENEDLAGTQIRWYRDGDMMRKYNDVLSISPDVTNPGEVWHFTVKPYDGEEFGEVVMSQEVTIINVKPDLDFDLSVDMIIITPDEPTAEDDLIVSIDTALRVQYANFTFQWMRNGVPIEGATGDMLMSDYLTKGDVVTVAVTPTDGYNKGDPVTSHNVEIRNALPTILDVTVSPLEAYKDSTLTATPVGFSDMDPDDYQEFLADTGKAYRTFKYQWYRQVTTTTGTGNDTTTETDWVIIPGATGMSLESTMFNKGDMVMVMVTPYDGEGYGEPVDSNAIEILNTPPRLDGVSLIPATPTSNVDIQAIPSGYYDLDGDDSRYYFRWYNLNGLIQQGWGKKGGNTLESTEVNEGEVIYVIVIPNDGSANGTAITSESVQVASDLDGDGLPDDIDHDSDNDGYSDELEKEFGTDPYNTNSTPNDLDGDGTPDQTDIDMDGDGILNDMDDFPMDPAASKDMDGDGLPDAWNVGASSDDSTTGLELDGDMDGDGIGNDDDDFPSNPTEWQDTDGDGIGDNIDPDADGDGVPDEVAKRQLENDEETSDLAADTAEDRTKLMWYFLALAAIVLILVLIIILLYVMRRGQGEDLSEDEPATLMGDGEMEEDEDDLDEEALDEDDLDEDDLDEEALDEDDLDEDDLDEDDLDEDDLDEDDLDEEALDEDDLDEEALDEEVFDEDLDEDEPEEDDEIDPDLDELPDDDLDEEKED